MLKSMTVRATLIALAWSISVSAHAMADTRKEVEIAAGDLRPALLQLSKAFDVELFYRPEQLDHFHTAGVKGSYTPEAAVRILLKGTPLELRTDPSGAMMIIDPKAFGSAAAAVTAQSNLPAGSGDDSQTRSSLQLAQATSGRTQTDSSVTAPAPQAKKKEKPAEVLEEVVVTGTYIHNVAPITPVLTLTQDQMISQGYTTLASAIYDLPQNFQGGGTSPSSNAVNGMGGSLAAYNLSYASGVNLRGLGGSATLVLLNGRRLAPTAYGNTVDISQIPVSAIDRVEILTDGASALYGSDAVAGVVNIVTKRDFSGFEIDGRSTGISQGKTPDYGADMVGGYSWGSGGFIASADYQKDNPLFARNRSFTTLPDPWALTPQDEAEHLYLSINQTFNDRLRFSMDTLLAHRDYEAQANTFSLPVSYVGSGRVNQYSLSPQLDYAISPEWTATLVGQWSKEQDSNSVFEPPAYGSPASTALVPITYQVSSVEPRVDGRLFDLPGGAVRIAIGGQLREEKLDFVETFGAGSPSPSTTGFESSRHVGSAYGELLVPIVGRDNAMPLVRELRLDVSGRYDRYSDFGGTTNPKVGISWSPIDDLRVHGSYARSFQAPTLYNASPVGNLYAAIAPSADASSPTGSFLGLQDVSTGNPDLQPETAKSFNLGFTFQSSAIPGLKLDVAYFSIDFDNQIAYLQGPFCGNYYCTAQDQLALGSYFQKNPSLVEVNAILNNPNYTLFNWAGGNYTPAPYTASDIKYLAEIGLKNAAATRVRGADFTPRYAGSDTRYGRFRADLDATYFTEYKQRLTAASPSLDIDNTTYNPLRLRAKTNLGWERRGWGTNVRVNFANAYKNTSNTSCPSSGCPISSWTTVDAGVSYGTGTVASWLSGVRFAINATNIFNRQPPFFTTGFPQNYGYDPVNASPVMRSVSVTFSKRWGGEDAP